MEKHIKVYRVHRILCLIYGVIAALTLVMSLTAGSGSKDVASVVAVMVPVFGVIFALHFFAAKGAKEQKEYGKVLSTLLAVLMLAGFPIGTFIGIYLLMNNFGWQEAPA